MLATRYDDVFELAAEILCPPTVAMALEGVKGAEWAAAIEAELDSLWENNVYEEVPRRLVRPSRPLFPAVASNAFKSFKCLGGNFPLS